MVWDVYEATVEEGGRGGAPGVPPHCDRKWRNICEY